MSVAVTSLPVPLSPVMSTVLSLSWMTRRNSNTARMRLLAPTTIESGGSAEVMIASHNSKRLELGDRVPQRRGHADLQRHLGTGAPRAGAKQSHVDGVSADADDDDVAAVRLQEGPHALEHAFDLRFGHHAVPSGQPMCQIAVTAIRSDRRHSGRASLFRPRTNPHCHEKFPRPA